jgi:DNA polymerase III delta prime subunit
VNVEGAIDLARTDRLYPVLILHGAGESERQELSIEFARTLLCEREAEARPCGECTHCRRIRWPGDGGGAFHPDFSVLERDLKTVTSVEATKAFLRVAQVSPFEARGQVFVVASAETLSGEAANALLKILEEPPVSAPRHFFLLAPSQLDLLPTVRSRALSLFLGAPPRLGGAVIDESAEAFAFSVRRFRESRNVAELLAAAAVLEKAGSWKDPRAATGWETAAAIVVEASRRLGDDETMARPLLGLAADLLAGPALRVRGIRPDRILEGLVSARLE